MNRRKEWKEAQKTPEAAKEFLTKLIKEEQRKMKTGYTDGNYTRKLIEETLEQTENPEMRAVLLECSRLCPPVDPFADLAFDFDAEQKVYPIYWEPGETVKFGRYPQGANGEVEPIEWLVLDADYAGTGKDTRLLISRYALDAKPYNAKCEAVTWETCTLRAWLNGEFLEQAFTEEEQRRLVLTRVENNKREETPGGNATEDRVFLLSEDEVEKRTWFKYDDESKPTQTAKSNGGDTDSKGRCWWWLRSPDHNKACGDCMSSGGVVFFMRGPNVNSDDFYVRPVVVLSLLSQEKSYAIGKALFAAGDYDGAGKAFDSLENYRDAKMRANESGYAKGKALFAAGDYDGALEAFKSLGNYLDAEKQVKEVKVSIVSAYAKGKALLEAGDHDGALETFKSLGGYRDAKTWANELGYAKGKALLAAGDHDGALEMFKSLGHYRDAEAQANELAYAKGKALLAEGDYDCACEVLRKIRGFKDVDSVLAHDENIAATARTVADAEFEVGKTVMFGTYGGERIEWLVLEANEDRRIMISVKALGTVCFNKDRSDRNKWENSYVRKWLNGTFYDTAFSSSEQVQLTAGVTGDKVYLLSADEANRYFENDKARMCCPTQYAVNNGANTSSPEACWWWLRSPGKYSSSAAIVCGKGNVDFGGYGVDRGDGFVRPVVVVRLV